MHTCNRNSIVLLIAALAGGLLGCATVTDRLAPDESEGAPTGEGKFLWDSSSASHSNSLPAIGKWWHVFNDPTLNSLMSRLADANPNVAAALARVDQSFAVLGITRATKQPTIRGETSGGRRQDSVNNLLFPIATPQYWRYRVGASAAWELDLWGRVRGMAKRDTFRAEAESATYANVLLSLQTSLARQYFAHRSAETELALLESARGLREENLKLEEARLEFGQGVAADVSRARLQLQESLAAIEAARRGTGKLLHALATLTGSLPSELTALTRSNDVHSVTVPAGLPSDLLVHRPDLLAADRQLRAAAAQVGIRRADFLPKITLIGNGGFASLNANNLFEADSLFFDLGPQVDIPIFGGGVRKAAVAQARAQWREAAANYQATFLTAVREVDDALLDIKSYTRELEIQRVGVQAAAQTAEDAKARHDAGLGAYSDYLAAEQIRLQNRLRENALQSERRIADVQLIQALGGSW